MNYTFNSSTLSNNSSLNTTGIVVPCFLHKYYCSTFHDYNKYLTHFYQTFISGASTLGIREVSPEYHRCSETNANLFITTPLQEFQTLSLWVQCSERPQTKQFKCQSKCVKRKKFFFFTTPPPPPSQTKLSDSQISGTKTNEFFYYNTTRVSDLVYEFS